MRNLKEKLFLCKKQMSYLLERDLDYDVLEKHCFIKVYEDVYCISWNKDLYYLHDRKCGFCEEGSGFVTWSNFKNFKMNAIEKTNPKSEKKM